MLTQGVAEYVEGLYMLVRPSLSVHCSLKITTLSDRYWPLKKHLAFPQCGSSLSV